MKYLDQNQEVGYFLLNELNIAWARIYSTFETQGAHSIIKVFWCY